MPDPAAVLAIEVAANVTQAQASLAKVQAQLEKTAATATAAGDKMAAAGAKAGAGWTAAGKRMQTVGKSMTKYITLPAVAVGAASVKLALDFDKSMTLIQTQAGASRKEVAKLHDEVLAFAKSGKTQFSPNDLAQALYSIESAGIHGAKAMETLKASSQLATVGQADLASTTKALAAAEKTGIQGSGNLKKAIGTLNATVGSGQMKMDDLVSAMGTGFLSSATALGISLDDVGASLAELTKQGVPAAAAATRLRMTFTSMATIQTRQSAADAIKGIGLQVNELSTSLRQQGLIPTLELLQKHLEGLSKAKQTNILATVFGGARSGGTIMSLLNNLKDTSKTLGDIHQNADKVHKSFQAMQKDPQVQLERAWSQLQAVLIDMGNKLLPKLIPLVQRLANVFSSVIDAFTSAPGWVQDFLIGAVVLGPFIRGLGMVAKAYGAIRTAAAGAAVAEGAAGGAGGAGVLARVGGGSALAGGAVAVGAGATALGTFHALTDQGGLIDTAKGHATANLGPELGAQLMAGYKKGIEDNIAGPKKALDAVSSEIVKSTGGNLEAMVNGPVSGAIKDLKARFGDLVAAGHSMSKAQREAWIHVAMAARDNGEITQKQLQHLTSAFTNNTQEWNASMKKAAQVTGQTTKSVANSVGNAAVHVSKTYDGMVKVVGSGLTWLTSNTAKAAQALGVKAQINFHTTPQHVQGTVGNQHLAGLQRGGAIHGRGTGDTVPAMLEPGEFVMNRQAVAGIGRTRLEAMNKAMPRFAKGGSVIQQALGPYTIPPIMYDPGHAGANSHVHADFFTVPQALSYGHKMQGMGWSIGEYTPHPGNPYNFGPITVSHQSPGHYDGTAFDANTAQGETRAQVAAVAKLFNSGVAAGGAAAVQKLKRLILHGKQGGLHLRDTGQAALDKVWHAGNTYLQKHQPKMTTTSADAGTFPATKGGWHRVGATYEGLDGQQGAYGTVGGMGFAELLLAGANAGMHPNLEDVLGRKIPPLGKVQFSMPGSGRAATAIKNDIGSGQAGNGHYLVDIQTGLARAIGWHPNQDVLVKQRGGMIPSFGGGGIVPGSRNQPQAIIAHGGEKVTRANENRRYAITITNWKQGTGYMEEIAGNTVDGQRRLNNQLSRMRR